MTILDQLVAAASNCSCPVKKVIVGAHWTLVESRFCGLASTQKEPPPHFNKQIDNAGNLADMTVAELTAHLYSENWLEASIGLATLNSTIEIDDRACTKENVYQTIRREGNNKNVGIIGHFPFVERLRDKVKNLWVFELQPWPEDLAAEHSAKLLPRCDVVGITATTLINHTFEQIIGFCRNSALKILIGPSTPMSPVLFDYGIDILAGAKVLNPATVSNLIVQGANFKQLKDVAVLTMRR